MNRRWSALSLVLALGCASPPPERPAAHSAGVTVSGAWRRGTVSSQPATSLNFSVTSPSQPNPGLIPLTSVPNIATGRCTNTNALCGSSVTAWMFGIQEQHYDSATGTYVSGSLADGADHPAMQFFTSPAAGAAVTEGRYKLSLDTRCRVVDITNTASTSNMPRCDDATAGSAITSAALTVGLYCVEDTTTKTFVERFTIPMSEDRRRVEYEFVMPTTCAQGLAVAFELRHGIETDVGLPDAVIGSTTSPPPPSFTGPWQFSSSASSRYLTYLVDAVTIQPLFPSSESNAHYRETALGLADYWRMFGANGHGATLDTAGLPVPGTITLENSSTHRRTTLRLADAAAYGSASASVPGVILERTQTLTSTNTSQSTVYIEVDHVARVTPPTVNGLQCFAPLRPDEVMPWSAPTSDEINAASSLTVPRFNTPDRRPRVTFAVYNPGASAVPARFSLPGNRTASGAESDIYAAVYGPVPTAVQNESLNPWAGSYRVAPSFLHKCGSAYNGTTRRTTYTCNEWNIPATGSRLFVLALDPSAVGQLALESPARACINVTGSHVAADDPSRRMLLTPVNQIEDRGADSLSMTASAAREYGLTDYAIETSLDPRCGTTACTRSNCDPVDGTTDGVIGCALDYGAALASTSAGAHFEGMRPLLALTGAKAQYPGDTTPDVMFYCSGDPFVPTMHARQTIYRVSTPDAQVEHQPLTGVLDVERASGCECAQLGLRPGDTVVGYKLVGEQWKSFGVGHVASRSEFNGTLCRIVLDVPLPSVADGTALRLRRVVYGNTDAATSDLNRVIYQVQSGDPKITAGDRELSLYPDGADSCPSARHILAHELHVLPCAEDDVECAARRDRAPTTLWPIGCPRPIALTQMPTGSTAPLTVEMQCWERRDGAWQPSLDCQLWAPFNAAQRDYYLGYATAFTTLAQQAAGGAAGDLLARLPLDMDEDKRLGVNLAPFDNGNPTNRTFFPGFGMTEAYDMARQFERADESNPDVQIALFSTSSARFVLGEARTIAEQFDPLDGPQNYGGIAWVDYTDMAYAPPMMRAMVDTLTTQAGATLFTSRRTVRSGGYERTPAFAFGERYALGLNRLHTEFGNTPMNAYLWNFYPQNATYDPIYADTSTSGITGVTYLRHRDRLGWVKEPSTVVARTHAVVLPRGTGSEYDESWVGASIYAGFEDYRVGRARRARVQAWRLPPPSAFGARDSRFSSSAHAQLSSVVRRDEHSQCMIERALNTDYAAVRTGSETPRQTLSRLCRDYY